jgi:hypothetical protein
MNKAEIEQRIIALEQQVDRLTIERLPLSIVTTDDAETHVIDASKWGLSNYSNRIVWHRLGKAEEKGLKKQKKVAPLPPPTSPKPSNPCHYSHPVHCKPS